MKTFRRWLLAREASQSFVLVRDTDMTLQDCSRSVNFSFWMDEGYSNNHKKQVSHLKKDYRDHRKRVETLKKALIILETNLDEDYNKKLVKLEKKQSIRGRRHKPDILNNILRA